MARITYTEQALTDLERLTEFLLQSDARAAQATAGLLMTAIAILGQHPLVGRPVEHGLRELVISRGRSGYLALYSYEAREDAVLILAIRHQREAGYVA